MGAPVVAYLPEDAVLVIGYIEGRTLADRGLLPTRGHRAGGGGRVAGCTRAAGFVNDFDMFEIRRGYLRTVLRRGLPAARGYLDFEPEVSADPRRLGRPAGADGGLQQRPPGRATSSTTGTRSG